VKVKIKKFGSGYSCHGGDLGHYVREPVSRMYVEVDVPIDGLKPKSVRFGFDPKKQEYMGWCDYVCTKKRLFAYKDFELEHKSVTDDLTLGEIYTDLLGFRDETIDSQWRGIEPEEINGWNLNNTALVDDRGKVHFD